MRLARRATSVGAIGADESMSLNIARRRRRNRAPLVGLVPEPSSDLGVNSTPPFQLTEGSCLWTILQESDRSEDSACERQNLCQADEAEAHHAWATLRALWTLAGYCRKSETSSHALADKPEPFKQGIREANLPRALRPRSRPVCDPERFASRKPV